MKISTIAASIAAAACCVGSAFAAAPTLSWTSTYGGPAFSAENAWDIATDATGNAYVLAQLNNGSIATPNYDVAVAKLSPTGSVLWTASYDGAFDDEVPVDIKVDGSGNVYVGFYSYFSASDSDSCVLKYNSSGVQQWLYREIPVSNNLDEWEYSMTISASRVYIGTDYGGNGFDAAVIAIDTATGTRQWGYTFGGSSLGWDYMTNVEALPNGNVVANGRVGEPGGYQCVTVCYNPAGTLQWSDFYIAPGATNMLTRNFGSAVDAAGNTYFAWQSEQPTSTDWWSTVAKYSPTGTRVYVSIVGASGFDSYPYGVAVDNSGNAYVSGYQHFWTTGANRDIRLRKVDPMGTSVWDVTWDGPALIGDTGFECFVDGGGDVTVCGVTDVVSGTDRDGVLLNFKASDGSLNWSTQWNNGAANDWDLYGFAVPSAGGSILVAGYTYINASDADALVQKYEFAPTDIVAAGYQVNYGVETTAPGVSNLQANDANTVQLCLNPDQEDPNPVQMEVSATNGNVNPSSLNFNLVCRAEANDREVYVEMFNFNVGDWVGSPSFPVTDSDALYTVAAPGTAGQFVNDGDGAMITRITGFLGAADSPTLPCWDFNYCYWN